MFQRWNTKRTLRVRYENKSGSKLWRHWVKIGTATIVKNEWKKFEDGIKTWIEREENKEKTKIGKKFGRKTSKQVRLDEDDKKTVSCKCVCGEDEGECVCVCEGVWVCVGGCVCVCVFKCLYHV